MTKIFSLGQTVSKRPDLANLALKKIKWQPRGRRRLKMYKYGVQYLRVTQHSSTNGSRQGSISLTKNNFFHMQIISGSKFHFTSFARLCPNSFIVDNLNLHTMFIGFCAFHRYGQANLAYGGSILGLSQFTLLSHLPLKMMLDLKVVKIHSKIVILLC